MSTLVEPLSTRERIPALDTLRGVALLGILLINIAAFALPSDASYNPTVYGGASGLNLVFWYVNQILFDGKMRCIFSMLFGAGAYLLLKRADERGAGLYAADIYYRRTLWLALLGLLHAYLIWWGDILFFYGIAGLVLLPFRRMSAKGLLIFGSVLFAWLTVQAIGASFAFEDMRTKASEARAMKNSGKTLTEAQAKDIKSWEEFEEGNKPDAKQLEEDIKTHRSGYLANLRLGAKEVFSSHTQAFYRFVAFGVTGAFFIGIGLIKLGVLTGERPSVFYWKLLAFGYSLGVPLNAFTGWKYIFSGFDPIVMFRFLYAGLPFGRLLVALGHIALVMLILKAGIAQSFTKRLAAVGP